MRQIKFRAWHEFHKEMVCFNNAKVKKDQYQAMYLAALMDGDYGDVLMQYTGLTDKNGVEVYENDIVQLDDVIIELTFDDGGFQMVSDLSQSKSPVSKDRLKRFEVIGNRFQNPELLDQ